jgi:transcriptional regulator with XRE-family HTH domain
MSQHQLASAAKVTAAFICYLENNERSICLKTLDRICQVLNVPISSILLEAEQLMIMGRDK